MAYMVTCPFCEKEYPFGEKCNCLRIKQQQNRLNTIHKKNISILKREEHVDGKSF